MTEESKAKQPDQTSKDSKTDGNPGTKESKTDEIQAPRNRNQTEIQAPRPRNKKAERQGTRGKKW